MKLLLWNCRDLKYKDTIPSDKPPGIATVQGERRSGHFINVLLAFTCIEEMDSELEVDEAVQSIISTLKMVGPRREVVVIPFAHMSSNLADPRKAVSLISRIKSQLEGYDITVSVISFGYHKEFSLCYEGLGHPGSVAFRSFPQVGHR
jgi:threonyl-tRNA synthetase